ncbi:hypothetical protein DRQ33_03960 [bacterium]|nr:MAG: hypothetical protein DRQ33_03960 [bacterium]
MRDAIFVLILIGSLCSLGAQDIAVQYFQEIDDISNAYYNDEITEEQYYELIQLFESKGEVNSGNLRRLLIIPGVEQEEIEALETTLLDKGYFRDIADVQSAFIGDFNLIAPFITVLPPRLKPFSGYFKLYTSRDYNSPANWDDPYHSSKLYIKGKKFSVDIKHRQKGTEMGKLTYRSIKYNGKDLNLIVGNFYRKDLGYGLLVGRHISLPSYEKDSDGLGYILSPYYGDMNGLYFRWEIGPHWSISSAISTNYYKNDSYQHLMSASIGYYQSRLGRLGLVLYEGALVDFDEHNRAEIRQSGASVYGEYRKWDWKLRNETAIMNNGSWGTNFYLYSPREDGASFVWKLWAYHPQFQALYSNGECDRGYESYYPDDFSFYLKLYQAGELGSYLSASFYLMQNIKAYIKASFFQIANSKDNGGEIYLGFKYSMRRQGYINFYIDRKYDGWSPSYTKGATKDKINLSIKWTPITQFYTKLYGYFKWNDYYHYWRNEFRLSNTFYYEPHDDIEFGLKLERRDSDIDDPECGYYTIAPVFNLDVGDVDWRTEFSFRKYDDESGWSLVAKINATTGF